MASLQLALVQGMRPRVLVPVLLSVLYQLYRWWLQRARRRQRSSLCSADSTDTQDSKAHLAVNSGAGPALSGNSVPTPCRSGAPGSSSSNSALHSGGSHAAQWISTLPSPLPRPGVDDDDRFHQVNDDPRYFEGAQLGKAQIAALGQTGLAGSNTVSFDPSSTLVRPSMRAVQGPVAEFLGKRLRLDDVVLVPEFFCLEESKRTYESLIAEIGEVVAGGDRESDGLPSCLEVVTCVCKYFALTDDTIEVIWYRQGCDPVVLQAGASSHSGSSNLTAIASFGEPCEFVFQMDADQPMHMASTNGTMMGLAGDAGHRWQQQQSGAVTLAAKGGYESGQVVVRIVGSSELAPEFSGSQPGVQNGSHMQRLFRQVAHGHAGNLGVSISRLPRPSLRFITVRPSAFYGQEVRHDDVISVPDFYCSENDWDVYYDLLKEMRSSQAQGERRSEWVSWHEGSHLLTKAPENSPTFRRILEEIRSYFSLVPNNDDGTRFNWYRDGSDWKPFHHDSAAFNAQRAATQNCSIGISFGSSRELAFRHAKTGELLYVPQTNGMLFFFGKDVNIRWQHGINALPKEEQDGKGRISIVLWGLCSLSVDEEGSPPMLEDRSSNTGRPTIGSSYRSGGVCRNFQQRGFCSYGDRCRYAHVRARTGRT